MTTRETGTTGGCQCGAVRYAVDAPAATLEGSVCHCRMCQKAGGGPFMAFVSVPTERLTWTSGAPALFTSSEGTRRGFCAGCGTPLTFQRRPAEISLTLGSLDDPGPITPASRLGAESVLAWSEHVGDLPVRTTASWLTETGRGTIASLQHPDHDGRSSP